jgi:hypothetical protein
MSSQIFNLLIFNKLLNFKEMKKISKLYWLLTILFIAINSDFAVANTKINLNSGSNETHRIERINNNEALKSLSQFKQKEDIPPKAACPLIPFGSITGKPTKDQIIKYLDSFQSVGIDQFLIYPRSGLEIEYMSDEWLDVCGYIIEYASDNGMSIWLYDEFNWPSGRCKGQVIKENSEYAGKKISVFADPVNLGKNNYYWSVSSVPLFGDILNPKAVDAFISLTHEKYYKRFGKYFGPVIKGIFTDEPSPMYSARSRTSGSLLELVYWDNLEDEYYEHAKRNFKSDVEAHLNGNTPANLWQDYYYLAGRRFRTVFIDKITEWCDQHNILFTGHLMSESHPSSSLWYIGDPMSVINGFSLPGIDEIGTRNNLETVEWVTMKMVENASYNTGNGGFAELFALGPCDMTLGKRRQMIWITALNGVDHYLLAISATDARANIEKPAYYNPHTTTQPWFQGLRELGEDAVKAAEFARKNANKLIAVRYPQKLTASLMNSSKESEPLISLHELLRNLINWQWNPNLIAELQEKTSEYKAVFSLTMDGIMEENSGKEFGTLEELSNWIENSLQHVATVENSDGKREKGIYMNTYNDGSVCVVSLGDEAHGPLVLSMPGIKPVSFELPEYGVFTYEPGQRYDYIENKNTLEFSGLEFLPYELTSTNTLRVAFDETKTFEFTVDCDLEGINFAVRNYDDIVTMLIDGKEYPFNNECHFLPEGIKELYLETAALSLGKGKHTLTLTSTSIEYPYLPSAFINGNFGIKDDNVLTALPDFISVKGFSKQGLPEYTGCIKFNSKVKTDKEEFISVDSNGLVTELFINNESVGRKAWAPYVWELPEKYRGKTINIEISIWTSVGPLFGDFPRVKGAEGSWLKNFAPN